MQQPVSIHNLETNVCLYSGHYAREAQPVPVPCYGRIESVPYRLRERTIRP